jgi:ABC-type phosphate transport system ATPase subunit
MQQAQRLQGHTIFLNKDHVFGHGYIAEEGTTADIFLYPKKPETQGYISGRFG